MIVVVEYSAASSVSTCHTGGRGVAILPHEELLGCQCSGGWWLKGVGWIGGGEPGGWQRKRWRRRWRVRRWNRCHEFQCSRGRSLSHTESLDVGVATPFHIHRKTCSRISNLSELVSPLESLIKNQSHALYLYLIDPFLLSLLQHIIRKF